MKRPEREAAVRQIMERAPVPVPPDLCAEAMRRGERLLRRGRLVRRVLWLLAWALAVAFGVWAARVHPWTQPPSRTTPLTGW